MLHLLTPFALIACIALVATSVWLRRRTRQQRATANEPFTLGFFHPYANGGGGGERVLWQYVRVLLESNLAPRILIYTGDTEPTEEILTSAATRFNLPPLDATRIEFVRLRRRHLLTAERWPRFTMVGQSIGSVVLACEALYRHTPHVWIDTTGFAFTYPIAAFLFGLPVHTYTHYPTISSDMLSLVYERRATYNNSQAVSGSLWKARCKWIYYKIFAALYTLAGKSASCVFVNSTWTREHIDAIWNIPDRTHIVYPPCDTTSLRQIPLGRLPSQSNAAASSSSTPTREPLIISIGQFRPEKDHALQIRAFALFLQSLREVEKACPARAAAKPLFSQSIRLVLIGGVRDDGDRARVEELRTLAAKLNLPPEQIQFELNVPFTTLKVWMARATVGLHTMWNEHFGMGIVEMMAAGVIALAHNSGGPRADILKPTPTGERVGYLATTAEEYADALADIFVRRAESDDGVASTADTLQTMREVARKRATEYSDEVFTAQLGRWLLPFLQEHQPHQEKKRQ